MKQLLSFCLGLDIYLLVRVFNNDTASRNTLGLLGSEFTQHLHSQQTTTTLILLPQVLLAAVILKSGNMQGAEN